MAAPNIVTSQQATFNHMIVAQVSIAPASVAANTTAEQAFTVQGLLADNPALGLEGDQVLSFTKPTFQAGLSLGTARVIADNTVRLTFGNFSAAGIVPTAELYSLVIWRPNNSPILASSLAINP
jgi:hypothetical protein